MNPTIETIVPPFYEHDVQIEEEDNNMFGVGASIQDSSRALVIVELSLFRRLSIPQFMCINPLAWWQTHKGQFFNVAIMANQMLGIPRFQVQIERVFSLASVLKTLRFCRLQVKNLDRIIIVVKNWSNDPYLNPNFKDYLKSDVPLVEENYEFIEKSEYFEELP